MERNFAIAVTGILVTIALVGAVALPAAAGQANEGGGILGGQAAEEDASNDGGSATTADIRSDSDGALNDDSSQDGVASLSDNTATIGQDGASSSVTNDGSSSEEDSADSDVTFQESAADGEVVVTVGATDVDQMNDDDRPEDEMTQIQDDEHGESDSADDLVRLDVGDTEISAEMPPEEDTNTVEVGPTGA